MSIDRPAQIAVHQSHVEIQWLQEIVESADSKQMLTSRNHANTATVGSELSTFVRRVVLFDLRGVAFFFFFFAIGVSHLIDNCVRF